MTTKIIIKSKNGLPRANKDGQTKLYVQYGHNSKSVLFPIMRVDIKHLRLVPTKSTNEPIDPYLTQHKGSTNKIQKIRDIRSKIDSIANDLDRRNIEPTVELVKRAYEKSREENTNREVIRSHSFDSLHSKFEQLYLRNLKSSTRNSHITSRNAVKRFIKHQGSNINVVDINLDFYDRLLKYLFEEEDKMENTVGKIIKDLKVFLNWLRERGYKTNPETESKSFRTFRKSSEVIYLTEEEFQKLYIYPYDQAYLERARDIFIFNCRIGLRYGDLIQLKERDFSDNIISIRQQKTDKKNSIPITSIPKEILEKYEYDLPFISEQKMNDYLKEACKIAGIDTIVEYKGELVPKHTAITTHTAIKTFITHCAEKGIQPKVVSEITGKSLNVIINHYYGIDKSTIKKEMERAFS